MADPTPPGEGLGPLLEKIAILERRLAELEAPTGTQAVGSVDRIQMQVDYLNSLQKTAATTASFNTGTVANDGVIHWFSTSPLLQLVSPIATGKAVITVEAGEASMSPAGSVVEAFCGFSIKDSTGIAIPGYGIGTITGRLYYPGGRIGARIQTPAKPIIIDTVLYPGPYTITGYFGYWSASTNTGTASCQFNDLALTVEVVGTGL